MVIRPGHLIGIMNLATDDSPNAA